MAESGKVMAGLTGRSLIKHPSLIPLLVAIGGGATLAFGYLFRLATRNPDTCWDRKNNLYPWQKLGVNGQYKFLAVNMDYSKLEHPEGKPKLD